MTNPTPPTRMDLCRANFGVGDTYHNPKYRPDHAVADYAQARAEAGDDAHHRWRAIRDTVPATYFVCADRADGIVTFPCTGSAHRDGLEVLCSCECHQAAWTAEVPG